MTSGCNCRRSASCQCAGRRQRVRRSASCQCASRRQRLRIASTSAPRSTPGPRLGAIAVESSRARARRGVTCNHQRASLEPVRAPARHARLPDPGPARSRSYPPPQRGRRHPGHNHHRTTLDPRNQARRDPGRTQPSANAPGRHMQPPARLARVRSCASAPRSTPGPRPGAIPAEPPGQSEPATLSYSPGRRSRGDPGGGQRAR